MELIILVIVIAAVVSSAKSQKRRNRSGGQADRGQTLYRGGQTVFYPNSRPRSQGGSGGRPQQTGRPAAHGGPRPQPGGPAQPYPQNRPPYASQPVSIPEPEPSASDWDWRDRKNGEDELEALIRQNHAYEKELEKLLAVQDQTRPHS